MKKKELYDKEKYQNRSIQEQKPRSFSVTFINKPMNFSILK